MRGQPARRHLSFSASHEDENGRGFGSINTGADICHRKWCFVRASVKALLSLFKEEADRVERYGNKTDAKMLIHIPDDDP